MANIGHNLRIRFGLYAEPSLDLQRLWAATTRRLIGQGYGATEAGATAAQQLFPDYGRMKYASEGDTIEMLLQKIKDG